MDNPSIENIHPFEKSHDSGLYSELIKNIETIDIVGEINQLWSVGSIEQLLRDSFESTGQQCIKDNDGTIFTTLSGGLDSSLALALLREAYPIPVRIVTVTMGSSDQHPDIQYARLAVDKFGSEHHEFIPTPNEINDSLIEYQAVFPNKDLKLAVQTGDHDVFMLYEYLVNDLGAKSVIAHDGIDEQMGGYWPHRQTQTDQEKAEQFRYFWNVLVKDHINPITESAKKLGVKIVFPYLDKYLIQYNSQIPLDDRTSKISSKKPIRDIAKHFRVPDEIITRPKRGQSGMMNLTQ